MIHVRQVTIGLVLVLLASAGLPQDPANSGSQYENLARGKPYVLQPKPNYEYTRNDPHALTRLTDGEYTDPAKGQYWIQPTTVGWAEATVEITLDLGEDRAIRGVSFGTVVADGTDVRLPEREDILVSANGRQYHLAGDLAQLDRRSRPCGYNLPVRLQTDELMVHRRYVKLVVHKGGRLFIFCDEIEVYRGPDAWVLDRPMPGPAIDYAMTLLENPFSLAVKARLDQDLRDARAAIEQSETPAATRTGLLAVADAIQQDVDALPELQNTPGYRAVFPLNAVHARTFALYGGVKRVIRPGEAAATGWREPRDRAAADVVRCEFAEMLEQLR